jgi:hypothetical protein
MKTSVVRGGCVVGAVMTAEAAPGPATGTGEGVTATATVTANVVAAETTRIAERMTAVAVPDLGTVGDEYRSREAKTGVQKRGKQIDQRAPAAIK